MIFDQEIYMFSKKSNLQWVQKGYPTTPLRFSLDVAIEVVEVSMKPEKYWSKKLYAKEITEY